MNAARDSEDVRRENDAIVCTQVGAAANVALALSKGAVGVIMQSTALIADAVHAASDLLTDFVVYFTITESRKAATPDRPWGMGKVEPLGELITAT
jgi:divalent metal cation (Fe/Co/Zn/Cd) transporter